MKNVFGLTQKDIFLSASDVGWDLGHMFTIYGPLVAGCTTVLYEGNLVKPDAGVLWRCISEHKVTNLLINASDVRRIKKSDYTATFMK